jgi:plasmid maintenance system antidote protein VapI
MKARKPPSPITDPLRRAIVESGASYKSLSRDTGVTRASIQRFVDGRSSLRLDMADRLADHFDLVLLPRVSSESDKDHR